MADKGGKPTGPKAKTRHASAEPPRTLESGMHGQLVTALGGGTLDFSAMLAIADIIPIPICYLDQQQIFRFANRAAAEWFERPRREILGRSYEQMVGPAAYAARRSLIEEALAGERKFFAATFDHPTLGPRTLQLDYVPWADSKGTVRGMIILAPDITEDREKRQALKESERRFRRIADSAPVLMWVTRLDHQRDFVNLAYAEFIGLPHEEARVYDWRQAIHPDDSERLIAESLAGEASLQPFTLEARYRRHDGEFRWLRSVSSPRFGPDGQLSGFIGAATDITVAKEAELRLKAEVAAQTRELGLSEARFRAVFDTVLEVLVLMEPDGTIVELNRKEAEWRASNSRDAIGKKIWDAPTLKMYPQHVTLMKRAVKRAAAGKLFTEEVRLERDGAPTAYLDVSVQPVRDAAGKVIYLLFEARDITELKAAQEQLRQSQKMEALGQLTGGIAHDFNNLLTVVVGGLDIIAKRSVDGALRRYAENALAAAERGARLTGQLLAFSRVQRLEVRPTLVTPLIQNMRPLLKNVLGPGITKKFELQDEGMPVMADPTQLEVALLNLAINARDAMPQGGVLSFSTRAVRIDGHADLADGDYVELTISDTGDGMPPEVAERAFEPFFTTKEVGKGTGLGLSMVYGMARQSGGDARIESVPGSGTTVRLLFRKADADVVEAVGRSDETAVPSAPAKPLSVLVIDDDPDVREFIVEALEEQGYRVRGAPDGKQGLAQLERAAADLVIVDFIMPGMSGADIARAIRERRPEQPILFVSGYSETEAVKRTAPDAPLLAKPFRSDALHRAVRGAMAEKA